MHEALKQNTIRSGFCGSFDRETCNGRTSAVITEHECNLRILGDNRT